MSGLLVPHRFRGPEHSGNGGWVAGTLAGLFPRAEPALAVTLRRPPPLDTPLRVRPDGVDRLRVLVGDVVVAEVEPATELPADPPEPVPYDQAERAGVHYAGLVNHPFPGCFVCGPARAPGDGLRLRPGPLADRPDTTATAWVSHEPVDLPLAWAVLDCPGGWAVALEGRPMVLGRMTAAPPSRLPEPGERCVVMGGVLDVQGRKAWTATGLFGADGEELMRAGAVWIEVPPERTDAG